MREDKVDFIRLELDFLLGHCILGLVSLREGLIQLLICDLSKFTEIQHRVFGTFDIRALHEALCAQVCLVLDEICRFEHLRYLLTQTLEMVTFLLFRQRSFLYPLLSCWRLDYVLRGAVSSVTCGVSAQCF